jgi:hypothetical protein
VVGFAYVQSNYFRTLSIPLIAGRSFEPQGAEHQASVVLSKAAAERLWPGRDPIGLSLRLGAQNQSHPDRELLPKDQTFEVVGIARDVQVDAINRNNPVLVYLPLPDKQLADDPILIRTRTDPDQLISALAPVISSTDPDLVAHASTVSELFRTTPAFTIPGTAAAIATVVGVIGLLLASMGIYGTVSHIVILQTREVGVRMALGAGKKDILSLMLGESIRPCSQDCSSARVSPSERRTCCTAFCMGSALSTAFRLQVFPPYSLRSHSLPPTSHLAEPCASIP